jgi:hypothetical protein
MTPRINSKKPSALRGRKGGNDGIEHVEKGASPGVLQGGEHQDKDTSRTRLSRGRERDRESRTS